jgi:small subunit ribosomal protein S13
MARIAGIDIPREKRLEISLTYILGIGRTTAHNVCLEVGIDPSTRVRDLTDEEVARLRNHIDANLKVEGDLRRNVAQDIKRTARPCTRSPRSPTTGPSTRRRTSRSR